jgi:hypothetical protein
MDRVAYTLNTEAAVGFFQKNRDFLAPFCHSPDGIAFLERFPRLVRNIDSTSEYEPVPQR